MRQYGLNGSERTGTAREIDTNRSRELQKARLADRARDQSFHDREVRRQRASDDYGYIADDDH